MTEFCSKCGRARPTVIADPTCPSGNGTFYGNGVCEWVERSRIEIVEPVEVPVPETITKCTKDCGTKYRGCSPECPRRVSEEFWKRGFDDAIAAAVHELDAMRSEPLDEHALTSAMHRLSKINPEDHR